MSQCVPNWDLDETTNSARLTLHGQPNADSTATEETMLNYEVAELTWENGQLAMHGLGPPRTTSKLPPKFAWEKPRASGTLESIVDQATCVPADKAMNELVPWFEGDQRVAANLAMDALVPCSNRTAQDHSSRGPDRPTAGASAGIGSRSGAVGKGEKAEDAGAAAMAKRKRVRSSQDQSVSVSETLGRESRHVTADTWEMDTSMGSHENTSSRKPMDSRTQTMTVDDHDSVSHSRPQASLFPFPLPLYFCSGI